MRSDNRRKDEARKFEQLEQWDKAIQIYLQILRGAEDGETELDLPLYNRIGDLYIRLGRPGDAVTYYEKAADHYAEAGLFNNAIALCNKALRHQPIRVALFRKLGQFCAQQGFLTDARRWYLEYADRMGKQGRLDDAFSALEDFADISEDPGVRIHLGRQLQSHDRKEEGLDEFRRAYAMLVRAGDATAAEQLRAEVLATAPDAPDLAAEELADEKPAWSSTRDALPGFSDTPEESATQVAAAEQATEEGARLEGLQSTRLAEDDALGHVRSVALEGLDTGRDETLDHVSGQRAPDTAEPLPLLDDRPPPAMPALEEEIPEDTEPLPLIGDRQTSLSQPAKSAPHGAPPDTLTPGSRADDYIDLYSFLAPEEDRVEATRFFVEEKEPTGDEDRDFAELLAQFRQKLAEHVPENDAGSHYDLGLAFKEMGLIDDAISEFQVALRAGQDRLKVFEELGQCFFLKRQYNVAVKVLTRALQLDHRDELELIGVYYHLGRAYEELGQLASARDAYERVMGLDIRFRDVQTRVARL
jgi:tetratricopeptide (TPR) repeat protein